MGLIRRFLFNRTVFILTCFIWILIICIENKLLLFYSNKISSKNFDFILNNLVKYQSNLILIDPVLLQFLFIHRLSFQQYNRRLITFAIFNNSTEIIRPLLSLPDISIQISTDHIFIEHNQHIVHLAILHEQKSYFLIEKNTVQLSDDIKLSFGDTIRVIEPFEKQIHRNQFLFYVPENISHFLWLYQTSQFISCNQKLAGIMEEKYQLYQNDKQFDLAIWPMRYIVMSLNKMEKHYWLAGGTLLGWYRHCGLIPYTQDIDLGLFAEEYDEDIRRHFLGNSQVYLWGVLGLVNDSLEFRLFTGQFTFDLFWAYRENDHRWCGYQIHRKKYKRILPLLPQLCSCDLFGYIFSIPCSPEDYLNNEYGIDKWKEPLRRDFVWMNVQWNSIWNDNLWPLAVHLYNRKGRIRTDKFARDWIEKYVNYSTKTLLPYKTTRKTITITKMT